MHIACKVNLPLVLPLLKASFEARDKDGNTPAMLAAQYGSTACLKEFSDEQLQEANNQDMQAIHIAAYNHRLEALEYLTAHFGIEVTDK